MHPIIFRVGESNRDARVQEPMQACIGEIASGDPNMVFGHSFPLLWSHQLHRWLSPCQLHRLHYPRPRPHLHLQITLCQTGTIYIVILYQNCPTYLTDYFNIYIPPTRLKLVPSSVLRFINYMLSSKREIS